MLEEILRDLVADQLVTRETADALLATKALRKGDAHPLVVVADQKWKDPRHPKRLLGLEPLSEWLVGKVDLPYMHIDPFKIDFAAVTKVMSNAYATRFRILPVQVTAKEVVVATCEPHVREWEPELAQILRLGIKRVLANPQDIANYQIEFYNLARSVQGASMQSQGVISDIANFEQLVQLGQAGKLDANDRHVVNIVDWLLQYAFDQRASDIHLEPRREAGNVRFRIDGVMHQVYQIPSPVLGAMPSRIKILGRMDVVEKRRRKTGASTHTPEGRSAAAYHAAFGEKLVMPFQPRSVGEGLHRAGILRRRQEALESAGRASPRRNPGDWSNRVGKDNHALLDPEAARDA